MKTIIKIMNILKNNKIYLQIIDILKDYGSVVVERSGTDLNEVVNNDKILSQFKVCK